MASDTLTVFVQLGLRSGQHGAVARTRCSGTMLHVGGPPTPNVPFGEKGLYLAPHPLPAREGMAVWGPARQTRDTPCPAVGAVGIIWVL